MSRVLSASITRPNNTTAYAAAQVIGNATTSTMVFNKGGYANGNGMIVGAVLVDGANQATKLNVDLFLFNAPPTAQADQAAWTIPYADLTNVTETGAAAGLGPALIGVISFGGTPVVANQAAAGSGSVVFQAPTGSTSLNIPYIALNDSPNTQLYGVLVARNAYTPVANEVLSVQLRVIAAPK